MLSVGKGLSISCGLLTLSERQALLIQGDTFLQAKHDHLAILSIDSGHLDIRDMAKPGGHSLPLTISDSVHRRQFGLVLDLKCLLLV